MAQLVLERVRAIPVFPSVALIINVDIYPGDTGCGGARTKRPGRWRIWEHWLDLAAMRVFGCFYQISLQNLSHLLCQECPIDRIHR